MDLRALDPEMAARFLADQEGETNHWNERPFPFAGPYHCQRQLHGISSPAKGLRGAMETDRKSVLSQNGTGSGLANEILQFASLRARADEESDQATSC